MRKIEASELNGRLQAIPNWTLEPTGRAVQRDFVLADFRQAFAFMTQIALAAEHHNHHPEWSNVYHRVSITWTTHDVGGLSTLDIAMAEQCDHVYLQCLQSAF
ncbi:MAG: 4a-hydroxytetrahydrobiopterin dehydratase [Rhodoferax sp.]|nr:4a-hydroxytetrahydrobiopterin dehydratase [Rhodoferax sp.]